MPDPVVGLVGFARVLREAGLACDPHRVQAYLEAASRVDLTSVLQLYWAGRVTLCSSPDDLPRYDAAFESWFRDRRRGRGIAVAPAQPILSRIAALTPVPTTSGAGDDEDAPDLQVAARFLTGSSIRRAAPTGRSTGGRVARGEPRRARRRRQGGTPRPGGQEHRRTRGERRDGEQRRHTESDGQADHARDDQRGQQRSHTAPICPSSAAHPGPSCTCGP